MEVWKMIFLFNRVIFEATKSKIVGDYQPLIKRSLTTTLHPKKFDIDSPNDKIFERKYTPVI